MVTQEEILARLRPATDLLAEAIPKAVAAAKKTFSPPFRPFCPITISTNFRYEMRLILDANKRLPLEDYELNLERQAIGNIGLQFRFNGILAKVLKGTDGKLPAATTDARLSFYRQDPELDLGPYTRGDDREPHVIYLWESANYYAQTKAWLIRPKSSEINSRDVEVYWDYPLVLASQPQLSKAHPRDKRSDLEIGVPQGDVETDTDS